LIGIAMGDATSWVTSEMLTRLTTVDDYFLDWVGDLIEKNPRVRAAIESRRQEVQGIMQPGDELWEWQRGRDLAADAGLAVVRGGQIVKAWADWKS
jgi:hypothetical protein